MKRALYLMLSVALLAGCSKDKNDDENEVKIGKNFTETVSGVKLEMVYVKGGTFRMGATEEQGDAYLLDRAKPVHSVTLSDYYIGKFEVTQGLWEKVMGTTIIEQQAKADYDREFRGIGADYPMYYVSWEEAQEFCTKLSRLTGRNYVLPTEAQWEYAARGGVKSKGYKYSGSNDIDNVAWYRDNCRLRTNPNDLKQPNELGIYNMSGNVWEWCNDRFGPYSSASQTDPTGPTGSSDHVSRGGCCYSTENECRVSYRNSLPYDSNIRKYGVRVAMIP